MIIGIDIGRRYIKIVSLKSSNPIKVDEIKLIDSPYTIIEDEEVLDEEKIVLLLNEELKDNISSSNIIVCLRSELIKSVKLDLPVMSTKELDDVVPREASAKMVPHPSEDSIFKYLILEKKENLKIFVACTKKDNIDKILSLYNNIKVPYIITFPPFAYLKLIETAKYEYDEVAFLDIGYSNSTISVFRKGRIQISRSIHPLCFSLITAISNNFEISRGKAEKVLIKYGFMENNVNEEAEENDVKTESSDILEKDEEDISKGTSEAKNQESNQIENNDKAEEKAEAPEENKGESISPDVPNEEDERGKNKEEKDENVEEAIDIQKLKKLSQAQLDIFIRSIKRTLVFYKERMGSGGEIGKIFLSGGGAGLKDLDKCINNNLDMYGDVEVFDIFEQMEIDNSGEKKKSPSIFNTALGLALQSRGNTIDFLPKEHRKVRVSDFAKSTGVVFLGIISFLILGLVVLFIKLESIQNNREMDVTMNKGLFMQVKRYLKKDNEISQKKNILSRKTSPLEEINKSNISWAGVLKEMTNIFPEEVTLTNLTLKKESADKKIGRGSGRGYEMNQGGGGLGGGTGAGGNMGAGVTGGSSSEKKKKSPWKMEISGFIVSDFKVTREVLDKIKANFASSNYFELLELSEPELEKVSVAIGDGEQDIQLTEKKRRDFKGKISVKTLR